MIKNKHLYFVLLLVLVSSLLVFIRINNKDKGWKVEQDNSSQKSASVSSEGFGPWINQIGTVKKAGKCQLDDESRINGDDSLKENESLMKLLRDNCFVVLRSESFDMTGDGIKDLSVIVADESCASCHSNIAYIFSREKIIFQKGGTDLVIKKPTLPVTGFTLNEPLKHYDEPMCCASEHLAFTYKYNPTKNQNAEDIVSNAYSDMYSYSTIEPKESPFVIYDVRSEVNK